MPAPIARTSAPQAFGKATLVFQGKTYETASVRFDRGFMQADEFQAIDNPDSHLTRHTYFLAGFLPGTTPGEFNQLYKSGITAQPFFWSVTIEGVNHQANSGVAKGLIKGSWASVKAEIEMDFGEGLAGTVFFDATHCL